MDKEDIDMAIETTNDSILHWFHDIYYPMLSGMVAVADLDCDGVIWRDTEEYLPVGSMYCHLCQSYMMPRLCCPECPLARIDDCCVDDDRNSSYSKFMDEPTTENAMNMILALVKARENLEDIKEWPCRT
jgi:hypothetical protein